MSAARTLRVPGRPRLCGRVLSVPAGPPGLCRGAALRHRGLWNSISIGSK
ncbi:peroxisome biogenesis factor 7 [Mus musculus]|nr:peroxisome biogenesis factor 7 [Mus musculus]